LPAEVATTRNYAQAFHCLNIICGELHDENMELQCVNRPASYGSVFQRLGGMKTRKIRTMSDHKKQMNCFEAVLAAAIDGSNLDAMK
jgi:hypothetical protein